SLGRLVCLDTIWRNPEKITAVKSLIAHQALDERDRVAIGRPARKRNLEKRLVGQTSPAAVRRAHRPNFGDPPIVVARTWCRSYNEHFVVGRPIVIINVEISR